MRVSCVHGSEATIAEFENAAPPGLSLTHFLQRPLNPKTSIASSRTESDLLVWRASRASDIVVVTCPDMVASPVPRTVSYPALVQEALSEFSGSVHFIGSADALSARMEAAVRAAGATVSVVRGSMSQACDGIARSVTRSQADHIVLLHAAGPIKDARVKLAAELALDCLAKRMPGAATDT